MRVSFGVYKRKINEITSDKLNLSTDFPGYEYNLDNNDIITFEVRQLMFYILLLPIFPVKKIVVVKRKNSFIEVNRELSKIVLENTKNRTPWYSFSLPIALILFAVFFFLNKQYQNHKSHALDRYNFETKHKTHRKLLENINQNLIIKAKQNTSDLCIANTYFCIDSIQGEEIIITHLSISGYHSISDVKDSLLSESKAVKTTVSNFKSLFIDNFNEKLSQSSNYSLLDENNIEINFNQKNSFIIEEIYFKHGPILLKPVITLYPNKINFRITNEGNLASLQNVNFNKLNQLNTDIRYKTSKTSKTYELEIMTNNKSDSYDFTLIFQDKLGIKYSFRIFGKEFDSFIEPLTK